MSDPYREPPPDVISFINWLKEAEDEFGDPATKLYSENENSTIKQWTWGWYLLGDPSLWMFTFTYDRPTLLVRPQWTINFTRPNSVLNFTTRLSPPPRQLGTLAWVAGWVPEAPDTWDL